jgi:hypothetical protein
LDIWLRADLGDWLDHRGCGLVDGRLGLIRLVDLTGFAGGVHDVTGAVLVRKPDLWFGDWFGHWFFGATLRSELRLDALGRRCVLLRVGGDRRTDPIVRRLHSRFFALYFDIVP